MPRFFGVRERGAFDRFWNEPGPGNDNQPDARWPIYVIGAAVAAIVLIGIFIA
ncbi:hypothetical protein LJR220_003361 [Bradyrhizobium sp. LjRoot220]|uniref:hypothetical protein n=1 Tax=Bradyrhizobium sp. LjRoot220 TaxID=3342284 RepID=UPI003ED00500